MVRLESVSKEEREMLLRFPQPTFDTNPWADAIKRHHQVNLVTVTRDNHQQVFNELRHWLIIENSSIPDALYTNKH